MARVGRSLRNQIVAFPRCQPASLGPGHRAASVVGKPKLPSTSLRGTPKSPGQSGDPAPARSAS